MPDPEAPPLTVFVVDDDQDVRDSLQLLLTAAGWPSLGFGNGEAFLDYYSPGLRGCVICDLEMPGLGGLDVQVRLQERGCTLPIIFLTGHGDVPDAVRAMKHGAVDFVQKPCDTDRLLATVGDALAREREAREASGRQDAVLRGYQSLTGRERDVAPLVVDGRANKVIAADLGISERTVEVHRSRIMRKMGAKSLPDLVRMFTELGPDANPPEGDSPAGAA